MANLNHNMMPMDQIMQAQWQPRWGGLMPVVAAARHGGPAIKASFGFD